VILLDTDHLTVLRYADHPRCAGLMARLVASGEQPLVTTVVNVEEQMRGWLAEINRLRDLHKQVPIYARLVSLIDSLQRWEIIAFDARAADECKRLQKQRIRIGTQDLKIASIALVQDALLLSANLSDFRRVPGLRVENWLV
jgi:tRNA(fMet)-specific endonuclease VapC